MRSTLAAPFILMAEEGIRSAMTDLPRSLDRLRLLVFSYNPNEVVSTLGERFPGLTVVSCKDPAALPDVIARERPNVILTYKHRLDPYPRETVVDSPSVRWIHFSGLGVDHLIPWDPARVTVTISKGNQDEIMSQYVIGRILMFAQRVPKVMESQRHHRWTRMPQQVVTGKTHVVLGFGRIGKAIGRLSRGLGMRVAGVRSSGAPDPDADVMFGIDRLHEALALGDFVTVVLPMTDRTRGLFDAACFGAMKPSAVLIDVGRGGIVREAALIDALRSGRLGGAALDVFETEPLPPDHPLWSMDNVLISPHMSAAVEGWQSRGLDQFCMNLRRWLAGDDLANIVDPAKGY